jgi:hypothetical protein
MLRLSATGMLGKGVRRVPLSSPAGCVLMVGATEHSNQRPFGPEPDVHSRDAEHRLIDQWAQPITDVTFAESSNLYRSFRTVRTDLGRRSDWF